MDSLMILYIKGTWESGHDGKYPITLSLDMKNLEKPFVLSEGNGYGLCGGHYSIEDLCTNNLIEIYNLDESKSVYEILQKSCSESLNNQHTVDLLMKYIKEKERIERAYANTEGMLDCIYGIDRKG